MKLGDQDGYGRYGYLDGDDERIRCHECGGMFRSLGAHVSLAHNMSADEYREAHGLPQRMKLISPNLKKVHSDAGKARIGTEGWQRMVAKRDPTAASHARTEESFRRRGEDKIASTATAKRNIKGVRKPVTRRCVVCDSLIVGRKGRPTCSPLCARIDTYRNKTTTPAEKWDRLHHEGESWTDIARANGVTHTNVRNTVLRYRSYLADMEYLREYGPGEVPERRD